MVQPVARSTHHSALESAAEPPIGLTPPTSLTRFSAAPAAQGLYDGSREHDACGVAFVARLDGSVTHEVVDQALTALRNLDHRGAVGAEVDTGDGAGILLQVPDAFLREVLADDLDEALPPPGSYAVGLAFMPDDDDEETSIRGEVADLAAAEGLRVLAWRPVPTAPELVGDTARACMPRFRH